MCTAKFVAFRLLSLSLCLLCIVGDVCAQSPATEESKVAELVILKPRFSSTLNSIIKKEVKWLSGTKRWTEDVSQAYIVMVPGSEGYPAHLEERQRFVSVAQAKLYRWEIGTIEFLDMDLQPINSDEAAKRITKEAAFLLASSDGEITEEDRKLYNQNLVIVRPK